MVVQETDIHSMRRVTRRMAREEALLPGVIRCVCNGFLLSPNDRLLECTSCHGWSHPHCMNVDPLQLDAVALTFQCPYCTSSATFAALLKDPSKRRAPPPRQAIVKLREVQDSTPANHVALRQLLRLLVDHLSREGYEVVQLPEEGTLTARMKSSVVAACQTSIEDATFSDSYPLYCLNEVQNQVHAYLQATLIRVAGHHKNRSSSVMMMVEPEEANLQASAKRGRRLATVHTRGRGSLLHRRTGGGGGGVEVGEASDAAAPSNDSTLRGEPEGDAATDGWQPGDVAAAVTSNGMDPYGNLKATVAQLKHRISSSTSTVMSSPSSNLSSLTPSGTSTPGDASVSRRRLSTTTQVPPSKATAATHPVAEHTTSASQRDALSPFERSLLDTQDFSDFVHIGMIITHPSHRNRRLAKFGMAIDLLRWLLRGRTRFYLNMALQKTVDEETGKVVCDVSLASRKLYDAFGLRDVLPIPADRQWTAKEADMGRCLACLDMEQSVVDVCRSLVGTAAVDAVLYPSEAVPASPATGKHKLRVLKPGRPSSGPTPAAAVATVVISSDDERSR